MAEEIEGVEALGADGKILRQAQEMGRNKVIRIFDQLVLGQRFDQMRDGADTDEGQCKPADALD